MSSWWHIVCCDSWIPVHHTSITDPWSSYNKICFNFCILRCFCSIKRLGQIWEGNRSLLGPNYLISSDWTFTLGKTLGIVHGAIRGGGVKFVYKKYLGSCRYTLWPIWETWLKIQPYGNYQGQPSVHWEFAKRHLKVSQTEKSKT